MNNRINSRITGLITMDRLFIGSKSEGLYPVLYGDDGRQYRLHDKLNHSMDEKGFSKFNGKLVQVCGFADNQRGHWRFVLENGISSVLIPGETNDTNADVKEISDSNSVDILQIYNKRKETLDLNVTDATKKLLLNQPIGSVDEDNGHGS